MGVEVLDRLGGIVARCCAGILWVIEVHEMMLEGAGGQERGLGEAVQVFGENLRIWWTFRGSRGNGGGVCREIGHLESRPREIDSVP